MREQEQVYRAVVARGYRNDWTAEEFLARNLAKMQEELAEATQFVNVANLNGAIQTVGDYSRWCFDIGARSFWQQPIKDWCSDRIDLLQGELADMQVVLFCLAAALDEISDGGFDVIEAALHKATQDVERGVR